MRTRRAAIAFVATMGLTAMPASAREEPDQCPGTHVFKEHPACPSAETLAWIDCPARWPADPSRHFSFAPLYFGYYNPPNIERDNIDRHPEGARLYCMYGRDSERHLYRLIIDVPGPIVQWGWHKTPEGDIIGCRVPKAQAATPPAYHVVPPIDRKIALDGFRLGMAEAEVRRHAAGLGYEFGETTAGRLTLRKADGSLDIILHPKTGKVREIIQALGDRPRAELERDFAYRFGLDWELWDVKPDDPRYTNWTKEVWPSKDGTVAVEWRPKTPFGDPATLHLIDLRK